MKIALAQINPTVGALEKNCSKIQDIMEKYSNQCDIIVFPEMVLTGYPPQDLLLDHSFIKKTEEILSQLAKVSSKTPVVLGTIRYEAEKLYNTAAVIQEGEIKAFRDKTHLPIETRAATPS